MTWVTSRGITYKDIVSGWKGHQLENQRTGASPQVLKLLIHMLSESHSWEIDRKFIFTL